MREPDHNAAAEDALGRIKGETLFVLVGASEADRDALKRWISGVRGAAAFAYVDIAREDEVRHGGLEGLAQADEDLVVAPVGIVRAPGNDGVGIARMLKAMATAPRFSARRTRSLSREPHRWVRLVGEEGDVGGLRRRYAALGEDARDAARFADYVARQSVVTIERERRKLPGARVKLPRFVVPAIMARADFADELRAYAAASGEPYAAIEKRARACLVELAPAPAQTFVSMMSWLTQTICSLGYDPKMIYDEARAREIDTLVRTSPTAFLFTHKTHVDGMAPIDQVNDAIETILAG